PRGHARGGGGAERTPERTGFRTGASGGNGTSRLRGLRARAGDERARHRTGARDGEAHRRIAARPRWRLVRAAQGSDLLGRSSPREPPLSDLQGSSILERLVEAEVEAVLSLLAHAVVEAEVRARLSHDEQSEPARHRRIPVPEGRVVPQDSTPVRIAHGVDIRPGDCAQPLPDGESELRFTVEERFPDVAALDVAPAGALVGIAA